MSDAPDQAAHAAFLERVRNSGISIDREGQLWHEQQPIEHGGLRSALYRWLDRNPDGHYVFRLDEQRFAHVEVADTPMVARAARWEGDRLMLALSDGSEEPLDAATLTIDGEGVLRVGVRGGRLEARLATSATVVLAERMVGEKLRVEGRLLAIAPRR